MTAVVERLANPRVISTWVSVARPHILAIVFASTLAYGWIFSERFAPLFAVLAVWDWFIVNFMNKAVDVEEDAENGIVGADLVRAHKATVERIGWGMIALGLLVGYWAAPVILPYRVLFTLIGLAYNYEIIPVLSKKTGNWRPARSRLKEMYFFKNFGSSMLFTLSVFVYPLIGLGLARYYPTRSFLLAIAFFIPLELTYEILYDLRDVDGDRALKVPTYPVVHGEAATRWILYGLLLLSATPMIAGAAMGVLRLREWVVMAGTLQQLIFVLVLLRGGRRPTAKECVAITYIGAAQLCAYCAWVAAGLPLGA